MRIKELCERTGISKRNVHFYIKEGIIVPASCSANHYYDFSEEDLKKLLLLKDLRNAGISLSVIRSIISTPLSASYYINRHINKLHSEKRHIDQVLVSLKYIMDELPMYPDLSSVCSICASSGIPAHDITESSEDTFDSYDTAIINMHLWGAFLPKEKFTDYQEFLWLKLNRLTLESPSKEYLQIGHFLNSIQASRIEKLFSAQSNRYNHIVSLKENDFEKCADEMKRSVSSIVSVPKYINFWKKYYADYFHPCAAIQASELSTIVMEISPFYSKYVENVLIVCGKVYDYLKSPEGADLANKLSSSLDGYFSLDISNHGELEALVNMPDTMKLL